MRIQTSLLFFLFPLLSFGQQKIWIRNVNLVDVIQKKILPNQQVLLSGDRIEGISSNGFKSPGAQLIDGTGKFLMPGLVDAHVHFFQSGGLYTRPDVIDLRKVFPLENEIAWNHRFMEDQLRRYISAGITTVIDVGSTKAFLAQRDSLRQNTQVPKILMTGPLITTWEPDVYKNLGNNEPFHQVFSAPAAKEAVRAMLPLKPDFIKIWFIVLDKDKTLGTSRLLPIVVAAIDEAHRNGLKVAVHATDRVTAREAVENGADYLVHGVDDEIIDENFLDLLKRKKTVLCPTLAVAGNYQKVFSQQYGFSATDHQLANPFTIGSLFDLQHLTDTALVNRYKNYALQSASQQQTADSILKINLLKLVRSGIPIATGTDAGNIGTLHASSYFQEINLMKEAGMSNWEILEASTINGAKALGLDKSFGSLEEGKDASLLLLSRNPVEDLANLRSVSLVFNKGMVIHPDSVLRPTPVSLVEQQLNGYNDHDLEAFLAPYAEDVELYDFPGELVTRGKKAMRESYAFIRSAPGLHCEILNRIVEGNTIIDHEKVRLSNQVEIHAAVIYRIENNKIKSVHFIKKK